MTSPRNSCRNLVTQAVQVSDGLSLTLLLRSHDKEPLQSRRCNQSQIKLPLHRRLTSSTHAVMAQITCTKLWIGFLSEQWKELHRLLLWLLRAGETRCCGKAQRRNGSPVPKTHTTPVHDRDPDTGNQHARDSTSTGPAQAERLLGQGRVQDLYA